MKQLLIVWHSQFGGTAQMAEAARGGAATIGEVQVVYRGAAEAGVAEMLACDGLLLATSENFGSLSGMTKDFLERVYYSCEDRVAGKPYSVLVCAGTDGTGAMFQTDRIVKGLRMAKVHPGVIYASGITARPVTVPAEIRAQCAELGATLAAGLATGIF
jgi:NAD(P)H-dependent FMN reductase